MTDVFAAGKARWAFGTAYLLATILSFPHPVPGTDLVLDLGTWFSWLSPACLLLAIRGLSPGAAAVRGLLLGLLAHSGVLHWAYVVTVHYGNAHPLLGVLAPVGMALYPAVFVSAFAAGVAWLAARGVGSLFVLAAFWVVLDHGRSWFLGGFPWATIGYAQHGNGWLLGVASATGVYGLSFAIALGGAALARLARERWLSLEVAGALGFLVAMHGFGLWMRGAEPTDSVPTLRVAAVQGNVDQAEKWSPTRFERTLLDYERGTREGADRGADVVVWPESAVTAAIEYEPEVQRRIQALARDAEVAIVFGSVGAAPHPEGGVAYYDSAFALDAKGNWLARYDKTHLVPFGEYVPFRWLIGRVATALATGISGRDLGTGERPVAFDIEVAGTGGQGSRSIRVAVPICYELLFPDLVRRFVRDRATVLLAITNDAWYGRTGAPYQFLAMTALRSAETGVWTVRAANTGVSAVIDAGGRVREGTAIFEPAVLVADVPLRSTESKPTVYVRFGDWFVGVCGVVSLMALGGALRRGRTVARNRNSNS